MNEKEPLWMTLCEASMAIIMLCCAIGSVFGIALLIREVF